MSSGITGAPEDFSENDMDRIIKDLLLLSMMKTCLLLKPCVIG